MVSLEFVRKEEPSRNAQSHSDRNASMVGSIGNQGMYREQIEERSTSILCSVCVKYDYGRYVNTVRGPLEMYRKRFLLAT